MEGKETKNTVAAAASSSPLFSFSNSNASFGFGFGFSASSGPPPPPPPPAVEVLLSEVYLARFPFFFFFFFFFFCGLILLRIYRVTLMRDSVVSWLNCRNRPSRPANWSLWWLMTPCRFTRCVCRNAYIVFVEMPLWPRQDSAVLLILLGC